MFYYISLRFVPCAVAFSDGAGKQCGCKPHFLFSSSALTSKVLFIFPLSLLVAQPIRTTYFLSTNQVEVNRDANESWLVKGVLSPIKFVYFS